MIAFTIESTALSKLAGQAAEIGKSQEATLIAGRGVAEKARDHFRELAFNRHRNEGPNFYEQARRSVQNPVVAGNVASVAINQIGIAQRLFGGVIRPVLRKFLTIPAEGNRTGKTAGEFSNLRFGFAENKFGNLAPALIEKSSVLVKLGRKRKDGSRKETRTELPEGKVMFWLARKVFQRADPTVLPTEAELETAARIPLENYLLRKLGGSLAAFCFLLSALGRGAL